jgi:hypothetical protein
MHHLNFKRYRVPYRAFSDGIMVPANDFYPSSARLVPLEYHQQAKKRLRQNQYILLRDGILLKSDRETHDREG